MKKIYNYLFVGIVAMLSMTLSSCNDDNIARDLDGIWAGTVSVKDSWRGHSFQYVEIEFFKNPYRYAKGEGTEYDYSGYDCYICDFTYEVHDNVIYIYYADGSRVRIYDYDLYNNTFRGEFRDGYTGDYLARFDFARLNYYRYDRGGYIVHRYVNGIYSIDADFEEDSKTNKTEAEQK